MKIALIGPAYPFRGGIAHHTNMLARYLRKHGHTVDVITFKRQYPKMLYPGAFQRENSPELAGEINSEQLIDSMNPLNWLLLGRTLRKRSYDLHIFRFWLPLFGPVFGTLMQLVGGGERKSNLVILDNLIPHERRPGDRAFTRYMFRHCGMAVTQSGTVRDQFREHYPNIPQTYLPHPTYENFGERVATEEARESLGIPSRKVILFFGFIRKYKGLDRLLEAMPELINRIPDIHLLIVGEFFGDPKPYLEMIEEGGFGNHVTLHSEYVPNEDVARWFSAADALVLPYHSATNSGIVQIGYNFATPSIVTDVGSLAEVVIDGKTGFVVEEASPTSLADAVERLYNGETLKEFGENIVEERKKYSWDAFVKGMISLVETVRG